MKWTLHKHIFAYCPTCLKHRLHRVGHFAGRKGDYKICTRCDRVTEVNSEEEQR